jgi:hypothetical protein
MKAGVGERNWLIQTLIWCGPSLAKFGLAAGNMEFSIQNEKRTSMPTAVCVT